MNFEEDLALDRELCRRKGGLYRFVKMSWSIVEPSIAFCDNWHIQLICAHLEAMYRGEIRDLMILQPPGTMKSSLTGVFFPAWVAAMEDGKSSWISASFDEGLTTRDNGKYKDLVSSEWYQACWPKSRVDKGSSKPEGVKWWYNIGGGSNFATSIKGKGTGHHADYLRVDDPTKPKDATGSDLELTKSWWKETFSSRRKDPRTTRRLVVQQRIAEEDLPAMLIEQPGWVVLCLPMEYDPDRPCRTDWGYDPRTEEGELMWPARYPQEEVDTLKGPNGVGEVVFETQYNQRPNVRGGLVFKDEWFQIVDEFPDECYQLQSWDMRFKDASDSGDMVVGGCWGKFENRYYRIDEARGRWSFVQTCKELVDFSALHPKALLKLIENKANGPAVVSALKKTVPGMVLVEPQGSKISRANGISPLYEAGQVFLVRGKWNDGYRRELTLFPKTRFDDRVDESAHALARLRDHRSEIEDFERAMDRLRTGS